MTLIVGIKCRDGVVMAADSAATYSDGVHYTIGQQRVPKLHDLGAGIYAATGAIGPAQQISNALRKLLATGELAPAKVSTAEDGMAIVGRCAGTTMAPFFEQAKSVLPLVGNQRACENVMCKSMVALHLTSKKIPCLIQLAESGAPEMVDPSLCFAAIGSGQQIADPFLAFLKRVLWSDREPDVSEGRFAAAWTIQHVAQTNSGGVGLPLQIATLMLRDKGVSQVEMANDDAIQEHLQAVEGAEKSLREHFTRESDEPGEVPAPPHAQPNPTPPASVQVN